MTPNFYASHHGFVSYPSTPVPPQGGPPLALTWNGTVSSQKMLGMAGNGGPNSVHGGGGGAGSHFGTVGANSYMSAGQRSGLSRSVGGGYNGPFPPSAAATPYYVTFPADSDTEQDRRSHR